MTLSTFIRNWVTARMAPFVAPFVVPFMGVVMAVMVPANADAQVFMPEPDLERVPVLLVPGWNDEAAGVVPLRRRLVEAGWPEGRVSAVTFRDPVGSNEEHAEEVDRAVEVLRRLTGAPVIDIVAHSMGGLAVRQYLHKRENEAQVRRAVFLGTPHRGSVAAILAWGDGGREMVPGSEFLERLNTGGAAPEGVEVLSVRSPLDLRVIPNSSAMLPGARNLEVCCPSHIGLMDDPETFEQLRRFLIYGAEELTQPDGTIPLRSDPTRWREGLLDR